MSCVNLLRTWMERPREKGGLGMAGAAETREGGEDGDVGRRGRGRGGDTASGPLVGVVIGKAGPRGLQICSYSRTCPRLEDVDGPHHFKIFLGALLG